MPCNYYFFVLLFLKKPVEAKEHGKQKWDTFAAETTDKALPPTGQETIQQKLMKVPNSLDKSTSSLKGSKTRLDELHVEVQYQQGYGDAKSLEEEQDAGLDLQPKSKRKYTQQYNVRISNF